MRSTNQTKTAWIITAVLAVLHFLPILLNGNHAYVRIHDTLEGELIWLKLLVDDGSQWSFNPDEKIEQVMNGLPRASFPTGLSVNVLCVYLFGTYWGYWVCRLLVHLIGFISMYRLLKNHFIPDEERRYIVILSSLAFSLIPVFSVFGLSVMGQPLILDIFLRLRGKIVRWADLLILAVFPLFSSVVWAAIPFLTALGLLWVYDVIRYRKFNLIFLAACFGLAGIYTLVNYPIFMLAFLNTDFISHRDAYDIYMYHIPTAGKALEEAFLLFATSHYHVGTLISLPILIAIALTGKLREQEFRPVTILLVLVSVCLFQGMYPLFEHAFGDQFTFLKSFRLNRYNILVPFLWMIALVISLGVLHRSSVLRMFLWPILGAQLFLNFLCNDEVLHNYRQLLGFQKFPNYTQYMAADLFGEIRNDLGNPEAYRVISIGVSPTIAQFNGFYTLDGLQSVYDLRYKQAFRKIFEGEIAQSKDIEEYFDGWGNRCYLFSSELGKDYPAFMIAKTEHKTLTTLRFDKKAFRALGGKFVFSALEIENHEAIGLHFIKKYEDEGAWWDIYVYEAKP